MAHDPSPANSSATAAPRIAERGVIAGGLRIATAMSDAPRSRLARVPLVVLPDAGFLWADYAPLLERFAAERRVFALDWPGFGASSKPTAAEYAYTVAAFVETFAGWLDGLGVARCVLAANGITAGVALRYAAAHPRRILGLALLAPVGFTSDARSSRLITRLLGSRMLLRRLEPLATSLALGPTSNDVVRATAARHHMLRAAPDHGVSLAALAAVWRDATAPHAQADLATLARAVRAPALVIRGALDPLVTAPEAHRAAELIGERGALEVTLPNAGHLPFLQQPERCFQALAGLLGAAELAAVQLS
jgi:pimeloyl-ACP methyl ester carboxylesterase